MAKNLKAKTMLCFAKVCGWTGLSWAVLLLHILEQLHSAGSLGAWESGWKVQDGHHPTRVSHLSVTKHGFLEGVVTGFQGGGFQGNKPQDTGPSNYLYRSD